MSKLISWDEIIKHTTENDCWIVIGNDVVNVTDWLPLHPGGVDTILQMGGRNSTNMFEAIDAHVRTTRATDEYKKRIVGQVDPDSKPPQPKARPGFKRDQKPVRYGLNVDPRLFWLAILAAIVAVFWLALRE